MVLFPPGSLARWIGSLPGGFMKKKDRKKKVLILITKTISVFIVMIPVLLLLSCFDMGSSFGATNLALALSLSFIVISLFDFIFKKIDRFFWFNFLWRVVMKKNVKKGYPFLFNLAVLFLFCLLSFSLFELKFELSELLYRIGAILPGIVVFIIFKKFLPEPTKIQKSIYFVLLGITTLVMI